MTRKPHDLIVGLQGLYLPSHSEHHFTKTQALEALREFKNGLWDEPDIRGQVRDGRIEWGAEEAYIAPCVNPEACEMEDIL